MFLWLILIDFYLLSVDGEEEHVDGKRGEEVGAKTMPAASVMTRLILIMVWRKLIRNPNTYSSIIGLTWSLISFRWNIEMPVIIAKSISILSDAGLGMAMFSLGQSVFTFIPHTYSNNHHFEYYYLNAFLFD